MLQSSQPIGSSPAAPVAAETDPAEIARATRRRRMRLMFGLLFLLVLMAVNLAIGSGKVRFEKVISESMEPGLQIGDVLFCDSNAQVKRYDVVIADDPKEEGGRLVKRVMGMPGDTILIDAGLLRIRGIADSSWREEVSAQIRGNQMIGTDGRWTVPPDDVFLMGDNRNNSEDSRFFGPVPIKTIRGVVSGVIWPPSRIHSPAPYASPVGAE